MLCDDSVQGSTLDNEGAGKDAGDVHELVLDPEELPRKLRRYSQRDSTL